MTANIEQKIIEATINCIEKYGLENVTNSLISEEAEVNSAAVSYYFRGKDNLIRIAQETALRNGFEWADYAQTEGLHPREQLKAILIQLAEGAQRYPNLTKSFFADAFLRGDYSGLGVQKLNEFLRVVLEHIQPKCPSVGPETLKSVIYRTFCGGVLPVITFPRLLDNFLGGAADNKDAVSAHIEALIDRLWEEV